jgi:hypothetical protein
VSATVRRTAPAIAAALALALSCPAAFAQCADGADCSQKSGGRVRLDLNLDLVGFSYLEVADGESSSGYRSYGFDIGPASRFGIGISCNLNGRLSLGARVAFGFSSASQKWDFHGGDHPKTDIDVDYAVLPYLEYAFGAGRIRPFLTVVAGVDGAVSRSRREGYDDTGEWTDKHTAVLTLGALGLGGGLHVFLADRISLDLWLLEAVGFGRMRTTQDMDGGTEPDDIEDEHFAWRSRTEIVLGLTGWI